MSLSNFTRGTTSFDLSCIFHHKNHFNVGNTCIQQYNISYYCGCSRHFYRQIFHIAPYTATATATAATTIIIIIEFGGHETNPKPSKRHYNRYVNFYNRYYTIFDITKFIIVIIDTLYSYTNQGSHASCVFQETVPF